MSDAPRDRSPVRLLAVFRKSGVASIRSNCESRGPSGSSRYPVIRKLVKVNGCIGCHVRAYPVIRCHISLI